jgi:hypothetical protein
MLAEEAQWFHPTALLVFPRFDTPVLHNCTMSDVAFSFMKAVRSKTTSVYIHEFDLPSTYRPAIDRSVSCGQVSGRKSSGSG